MDVLTTFNVALVIMFPSRNFHTTHLFNTIHSSVNIFLNYPNILITDKMRAKTSPQTWRHPNPVGNCFPETGWVLLGYVGIHPTGTCSLAPYVIPCWNLLRWLTRWWTWSGFVCRAGRGLQGEWRVVCWSSSVSDWSRTWPVQCWCCWYAGCRGQCGRTEHELLSGP